MPKRKCIVRCYMELKWTSLVNVWLMLLLCDAWFADTLRPLPSSHLRPQAVLYKVCNCRIGWWVLKMSSKLIKKIKITLSLRCLTWFVCSHRTPQSGLCYCQEQTPCVVYSWFISNSFTSFKTQSFFTSSLKFQVSTVSADFSFIIILLPLLYFFYLHCEIWNLKAKS